MGHALVGDPAYGIYGEASANGGFSESLMDGISQVVSLSDVPEMCDTLMASKIKGRIIVDVNAR